MESQNAVTIEEISDPDKLTDDKAHQVIELILDIFRASPEFVRFLDSARARYGTPDKFRGRYMEQYSGTVFTATQETNQRIVGVLCATLGKSEVLKGMPELERFGLDRLLYVDYGSVKEPSRGQGILGSLFEKFLDRARQVAATQPDGQINVFLNLHPQNKIEIIQPIFKRRGFAPVGEIGEVRKGLLVMHRVIGHL